MLYLKKIDRRNPVYFLCSEKYFVELSSTLSFLKMVYFAAMIFLHNKGSLIITILNVELSSTG